jgi:hypothetical protein
MVARLRRDATLDTARAEAAVISARLESADARFSKGVRALVTESLLLVAAGAAAGWVLASALLPAAIAIVAPDTPRLADVSMNLPVLAFTLAASMLTILLAGALPAWRMSRVPIRGVLSSESGQRGPGRTWRLRAVLAGVQAAVSVLVIVGAVLFGRTPGVLLSVEADRGGHAVVTMRVTLPEAASEGCPGGAECQRLITFAREALARVGRLGGVQAAALTRHRSPLDPDRAKHLVERAFVGLDIGLRRGEHEEQHAFGVLHGDEPVGFTATDW